VELDAVEAAPSSAIHRERRALRGGDHLEAQRDGGDPCRRGSSRRSRGRRCRPGPPAGATALDQDLGAAELAVVAAFDRAPQLGAHGHLAVADAQHRHAELEDLCGALGSRPRARWPGRRTGSPPWARRRRASARPCRTGWISQ
jgi:hypothetical protein